MILKNDFTCYKIKSMKFRVKKYWRYYFKMNRSVQSIFESLHFRQIHTPFLQLPPLRRWAKHLIAQAEWLMLSHFDCHDKTSHVTLRCRSGSSGSLESINSVSGSIFSSSICPSEKLKSRILFHLSNLFNLSLIDF